MRILPAAAALPALVLVLGLALPGCGEKETIVEEVAVDRAALAKPADHPGVDAPPTKTLAPPGVTEPTPPEAGAADATTVTLALAGLHCERDCVPRVEEMLGHAPGVESVAVEFDAQQAVVRVRAGTVPEDVAAAVSGGFAAEVR